MAIETKPGQTVRVTILKTISREGARKTLERLFMTDKAHSKPVAQRSAGFAARPKRRGGRIWTRYPDKLHLALNKGDTATIKATAQAMKDLASVAAFVTVE